MLFVENMENKIVEMEKNQTSLTNATVYRYFL